MKKFELTADITVPADWVNGKENVTIQEWGQREWDSGLKTGYATGIEYAQQFILTKALAAFERNEDDLARMLRRLSQDLEKDFKENQDRQRA
jgi:hypothetical protein